MKIAIIGTDGLPARYGGFETCVEQLAPQLAALGHEVVVVGSARGRVARHGRRGAVALQYLPLSANGAASVVFDLWSFLRTWRQADAILLLGYSGGIFMPLMRWLARRRPVVVNVDGLETRRAKWRGLARRFLAESERCAVRHASAVVSDNAAIAAIVERTYGRTSRVIAYGNDHVLQLPAERARALLWQFQPGLVPKSYLLTVARIEPENQVDLMIDAFLASPLPCYVVVGNFAASAYGRKLLERYRDEPRLQLVPAIYEPELLAALRSQCQGYLHGHSVGGTNPSLIEMLPYMRPILAFDCAFNRETLRQHCGYFIDQTALQVQLVRPRWADWTPPAALAADPAYAWASVATAYVSLLRS